MQQEYKILKVQRISDGEVFSVGDTIVTIYKTDAIPERVIEEIRIDSRYGGNIALSDRRSDIALSIAKHVESQDTIWTPKRK